MTRTLSPVVTMGAIAAITMAPASPRLARAVIQVSVTRAADAVEPLRAEDFDVALDGAPIAVKDVVAPPQPATVVLLVDATVSMPLHLLDLAPSIASGVVRGLSKDDRVRLGVISGAVRFAPGFTGDARSAMTPLITFFTRGDPEPSPIWDAIDDAAALLEPEHGLRSIAAVTDGKASGNRLGYDDIYGRVLRDGVRVDVIAEAPEGVVPQQGAATAAAIHPSASLRALADMSGGVYLVDGPANVQSSPPRLNLAALDEYREQTRPRTDALIERVFAEAHRTYLLGIDVPSDQVAHRIDVQIRTPGAVARGPREVAGGPR